MSSTCLETFCLVFWKRPSFNLLIFGSLPSAETYFDKLSICSTGREIVEEPWY